MADGSKVLVFAGPCLSRLDEARRAQLFVPGVEQRPPARRGDLLAALAEHPHTIVLLDGYFFHQLSVAHKELLAALQSGVRVIGAASMGALRAAEMGAFGMIGVGRIHRWFADGVLDGDDEVTVHHLPEEHGYGLLSVALVEVRHALALLVERAVCTQAQADAFLATVQPLAFSERSHARVEELARAHLGAGPAARLQEQLEAFSLKQQDAEEAILLAYTAPAQPARQDRPRPATDRSPFLNYWCEDSLRAPAKREGLRREATLMRAWNMAQLFHPGVPGLVEQLRLRFLAASAVEQAGLAPDPARLDAIRGALTSWAEQAHGGPVLPPAEIEQEVRLQSAGELACGTFGGPRRASSWLAVEYGLDTGGGGAELLELVSQQYGLLSSWALVRAFTFTRALAPALELAVAADEASVLFQNWSGGSRISREDLIAVGAELWGCAEAEVPAVGARRGLIEGHGFSEGLREILQRVAPAERLREPINDYPQRKQALVAAALEPALAYFTPSEGEPSLRAAPRPKLRLPGQ